MSLKKTLLSIITAATISLAGCSSQLYQEDIPKNHKENPQIWPQLQEDYPKTPTEIIKFMSEKIIFVEEKEENWSSARVALERGYGDCDEFAIIGSYLAEKLGYPAKLLYLVDPFKGSHTVSLLEEKTKDGLKYGYIDQTEIFCPIYDSIEALVCDINYSYSKISKEAIRKYKIKKINYKYYSVLDIDSLDKEWRTTDKNLAFPQNEISLNLIRVPQLENKKKNIIEEMILKIIKALNSEPSKGYRAGSIIFYLPKENAE